MGGEGSGELFRKALDDARTAVYVGTTSVGIYANKAMVELTGRDLVHDLLAKGIGVCFAGADYEEFSRKCCVDSPPPKEPIPLRIRRPLDGERRVRIAWQPLAGFPYYVVTLEDVTELSIAEQELRTSEQRLRAIMDNLPFMAWMKDRAGRFLSLNQPFASAAGVDTTGELLGKTDLDLWPSDLAAKYRNDDLLVMGEQTRFRTEEFVHHPTGDIWHETHKAPMFDGNGRVIGTVGFAMDITERKQAELERLQVLGQMQRYERLESLGFLAGGIAHDFNNLLAGLFGHLERALDCAESAEQREHLSHAMGAFERARKLTGQLLTFSTGGAPVKQTTDMAVLVRETVEFVLRGSNVEAVFDFEDHLMRVECDHGQISQVVHNIALNAVQAMQEGGHLFVAARNIDVSGVASGGLNPGPHVEFVFKDEGKGIPPDVLEHIFDPFFTTKPGGTGLGLATSHSIVRRHAGTLTAESRGGEGALLRIALPALERRDSERRVETLPPAPHKGGGRALILDDEPVLRELLLSLFEELGYEVSQTSSGTEALRVHAEAVAEGRPFAVALLDLTIPGGMGGREVMAELRMRDPALAAIASSGYAGDPVMANPFAYGFDACLTKPFRFAELGRQLDFAVARRAEYRGRS